MTVTAYTDFLKADTSHPFVQANLLESLPPHLSKEKPCMSKVDYSLGLSG